MKFGFKAIVKVLLATSLVGLLAGCSEDQSNDPLKKSGSKLKMNELQFDVSTNALNVNLEVSYELDGNATISDMKASIEACNFSGALISGEENNGTTESNINSSHPLTYTALLSVPSDCNSTTVMISGSEKADEGTVYPISSSFDAKIIDTSSASPSGSEIATISPVSDVFVTTNNEAKTIEVRVKGVNGSFVKNGSLSVGYPDAYFNGEDTGYFKENEVQVVDTKAVFTYIGPNDVYSIATGTKVKFRFFDTLNPATLQEVTIDISADTSVKPPVLTGYTVDFVGSNSKPTVDLENTTIFTLTVKDRNGQPIADADLISVDTTSLQPNLVKFILNDGTRSNTFPYPGKNAFPMTLETNTISGLVPIEFKLKIRDANGNIINKNVTKSVTVFSGPPTAMSISYSYTDQDKENAKFVERMVISLTDKWQNPVNTSPTVYAGAITGYKKDTVTPGIGNNYLLQIAPVATIDSDGGDGSKMTYTAGDLSDVVPYEDILMTFGNGYTYQASGKWDITSVSATTVNMKDKYTFSSATSGMGYAIGHNHRQDTCEFGREWIGQVDSADGKYVVDATGSAIINFRYDYILTGKTIVFGASVLGVKKTAAGEEDIRMGEAVLHTLRGHGYDGSVSCSVPAGQTMDCGLNVRLTDTNDNARNINFKYDISGGEDLTIVSITDSMGANLYNCPSAGRPAMSYASVRVNNATATAKTIGVTIAEKLIYSEF